MPKLYEIPAGSKIRVVGDERVPPGGMEAIHGVVYKFFNIDGMYSYCTDPDGNVVHLVAWAEVEVVAE